MYDLWTMFDPSPYPFPHGSHPGMSNTVHYACFSSVTTTVQCDDYSTVWPLQHSVTTKDGYSHGFPKTQLLAMIFYIILYYIIQLMYIYYSAPGICNNPVLLRYVIQGVNADRLSRSNIKRISRESSNILNISAFTRVNLRQRNPSSICAACLADKRHTPLTWPLHASTGKCKQ